MWHHNRPSIATIIHKNYKTNDNFYRKVAFLIYIGKWLVLGLKAKKQLLDKNHTEDWALGRHPRDNGHVTH